MCCTIPWLYHIGNQARPKGLILKPIVGTGTSVQIIIFGQGDCRSGLYYASGHLPHKFHVHAF